MVNISPGKSPILLEKDGLVVRLAETPDEVRLAQNLRQRCFIPRGDPAGFDIDRFDAVADHLVAIHVASGRVVGTYRFIRQSQADKIGNFYSATEFDLSFLSKLKGNTLEAGRSCIDADWRKSGVATMLWLGCGAYVSAFDIENLFGCASFPGIDPAPVAQALSWLHYEQGPPEGIEIPAITAGTFRTDCLPRDRVDRKLAMEQMPPLVKAYSKMGGWFSREAAIDPEFRCIDLLLCITGATAPARYHKRFMRPDFVVRKPLVL